MNMPRKETLINPDALHWRESNFMHIPNADYLERTESEMVGARLWRMPPKSANTLHHHITSEEFYVVLEGTGKIRVDGNTYTVERYGGIHVWPEQLRQVFNDTDEPVLWLVVGAPDNEIPRGEKPDYSKFYPSDPTALPPELDGVTWPPKPS